jgi:hypothetical protein
MAADEKQAAAKYVAVRRPGHRLGYVRDRAQSDEPPWSRRAASSLRRTAQSVGLDDVAKITAATYDLMHKGAGLSERAPLGGQFVQLVRQPRLHIEEAVPCCHNARVLDKLVAQSVVAIAVSIEQHRDGRRSRY